MAYQPVGNPGIRGLQPAHLDNIELDTRYDPAAYNTKYASPPGHPLDEDSKFDEDDKKPLFRATSKAAQAPGSNWPVEAQRVATVTPLRAGLMVFDAVLASTPLMFVGTLICDSDFALCLDLQIRLSANFGSSRFDSCPTGWQRGFWIRL
jgi:hypothetical protein